MKILHLPTSVGSQSWNLSQAEKVRGVDSTVLTYDSNYLKYPADIHLELEGQSTPGKFAKLFKAFLAVRGNYDIFHFNWGTSLLTSRSSGLLHLELPFYPDSAKLFVTYNGCDARQKYPTIERGGISACAECQVQQCESGKLDRTRQLGIEKMARHVEHSWALNPDLLHFLPSQTSSFLPYAIPGLGVAPSWPSMRGSLKLVHAPTNRDIKGTHYLLEAVDRLNQAHPGCIELVLVEGLSHVAALQKYQEADLVVDQLLIGWYGGFAVESMLLGKPVIARIAAEDLHFIPAEMAVQLESSMINADPGSLDAALLRCVKDREYLARVARNGYEYACTWHDPAYVASLCIERYLEAV